MSDAQGNTDLWLYNHIKWIFILVYLPSNQVIDVISKFKVFKSDLTLDINILFQDDGDG